MFQTVLLILVCASVLGLPVSCVAGLVWWKRSAAQVGWRWGMSRTGVVLMCGGVLLCVSYVIAGAMGMGPVFGDPTRYAMWSLSADALALVMLIAAVLGKSWIRAAILVNALSLAFLGIMVAESF